MARFYDDVKEHIDRRDYDGIEALDKAIVISATNIAKFADMTDQKAVNEYLTEDAIRDLPCVLPPFPYTFIEFTLPYVGTQGWLFTRAAIENGDVLHPEEKSKTGEGWMVRGTYFSSKVLNRPHATADFRIDDLLSSHLFMGVRIYAFEERDYRRCRAACCAAKETQKA